MTGEKRLPIRRSFRFQCDIEVTKVTFVSCIFWTNIWVNVLPIIRCVDELLHFCMSPNFSFFWMRIRRPGWLGQCTVKYLFLFHSFQSSFLSLVWWYKFNTLNTPKSSILSILIKLFIISSYKQLLITLGTALQAVFVRYSTGKWRVMNSFYIHVLFKKELVNRQFWPDFIKN